MLAILAGGGERGNGAASAVGRASGGPSVTLSGVETSLLAAFLLLLMLGMGATLRLADFAAVLRRPVPVLIGLASQFGWMPLIAFALARALELPPLAALGLVVMGCSSGGTTSNFFTYLSRADLALSISMTIVSTTVAVVAIPALLWLYTRGLAAEVGDGALRIPYANIVTTLVGVLVPVAIGIAIRARSERLARRVERGGTIAGFAMLTLVIVGSVVRDGARLFTIEPNIYVAATLLGPIGFVLGLAGDRVLGLSPAQRRAVSLETGIQNAPLALGIILLSFEPSVQRDMLPAPLLYGVIVVPWSALAAALFRRDRL